MIVAQKWYCIAQTTSIGSSSGIKVEFGNYYRLLLNASVDWGNAVISIQSSNISKDIVASVRLRNNGQYFYLDIKLSKPYDTDFSTSLYDNSSWNLASSVSDLSGVPICIIDDINSLNTPQTGGKSYFVEDENGDLHPIPKEDGTARGIYTDSFISSGGKNPNTEGGGGGGFTEFIIKFDDVEVNPEGYKSVDGVVTLPNYPSLDGYLLKDTADNLYQAKGDYATREELNTLNKYIKSLFTAEYDENDVLTSIKANAGLYTDSFLSSGGKNANAGGEGGGVTSFDIMFEGDNINRYPLENGVVILPAYPTVEDIDLSPYLTRTDASRLYVSKDVYNTHTEDYSTFKSSMQTFKALFDEMFEKDADGHIHAKLGLYTDSFLSSGGKNEESGSTGGLSQVTIKFDAEEIKDEYTSENGVVSLPAYPIVPDVSGFILKTTADTLYQPKGNYLTSIPSEYITETELSDALSPYLLSHTAADTYATIKALNTHIDNYNVHIADYTAFKTNTNKRLQSLEDMFEWDDDGHIKAKAGLYTDSFLSSGGKNTTGGNNEGGLTEFSVIFNGTQYDSSNGVATIDGTYATSDAVNNAIATSKSYTDTSIANLINGAPSTLDTLKEIADAMAANEDVVDALEEAIGTKASQSNLDALSGRVTTAEMGISANNTAVKGLETRVGATEADIATLKTNVGTLQGYFTNGIANEATKVSNIFKIIFNGTTYEYNGSAAKEINFSATNIVSALGTTPVNRATGDESGNNIKTTYATKTALQDFIDKIEKYFTFGEDNIKANYGLWTDSYLSSGGQNTEGGSGGGGLTSFSVVVNNKTYNSDNGVATITEQLQPLITATSKLDYSLISGTPTLAAVATSGKYSDLSGTPTIPTSLKSPYALTFGTNTYDGSAAKTITASDLGALTSHQTIYALTIKNSAGTTQVTYTPNSGAKTITLTKGMVGLGNVDNTKDSEKSVNYAATAGSAKASDVYSWAKAATKPTYTASEVGALPLSGGTVGKGTTSLAAFNVSTDNSLGYPAIGFYSGDTRVGLIRIEGDRLLRIYDSAFNATTTVLTSINYSNYALPLSGGTRVLTATSNTVLEIKTDGWHSIFNFQNNYGSSVFVGYYSGRGAQLSNGENYLSVDDNGVPRFNTNTLLHSGNIKDYNAGSATKLQTARTIWGQSFDGTGNISGSFEMYDKLLIYPGTNLFVFGNETTDTYLRGDNIRLQYGSSAKQGLILNSSGNVTIGASDLAGTSAKLYVDGSAYMDGNVGIGTTSPSYKLDVNGQTRIVSSPFAGLVIHRQGSASSLGSAISLSTDYAQLGVMGWNQYNEFKLQDGEGNKFFYGGKDGVTIDAMLYAPKGASVDTLTIANQGAPAHIKFSRAGFNYVDTPTNGVLAFTFGTQSQAGSTMYMSNGSVNVNGKITASSSISIYTSEWASFSMSRGTYGVSSIGGLDGNGVYFAHTQNSVTTHMYLKAGKGLQVASNIAASGNITTSGRFYDSSDIRLKDIQSDLSDLSLDDILSIPRIRYSWKKDSSKIMIGTIAQPLIGKFDELLHKDNEGMYSVDYDSIGVIALEGVSRVKSEVDILKERIVVLEQQVKRLGGTI